MSWLDKQLRKQRSLWKQFAVVASCFFISLPLFVVSCSYTLVGEGLKLPQHVRKISIPVFRNKTRETQIERDLTRAVREEFIVDGRLRVVSEKDADAVLLGEIESFSLSALAFDARDRVTEYRLKFSVLVILQDMIEGKPLFKENLKVDKEYRVTSSIADTESRKQAALQVSSRDFALELLNLLTEGF